MVEVSGPLHPVSVGARVVIETVAKNIPCEVVGFSGSNALFDAVRAVRRRTGRDQPRGRRGHPPARAAGRLLAQGKEEATGLAEGYRRLDEILTGAETER